MCLTLIVSTTISNHYSGYRGVHGLKHGMDAYKVLDVVILFNWYHTHRLFLLVPKPLDDLN